MIDFLHVLEHSFFDSLKLIPFLFLTYLLMEYLEHRSGDIAEKVLGRSGQFGALIGGALGLIPQCGFSSAAAGLYAARVISLGTLISVFLSTSDEMLPIFLSHSVSPELIIKILAIKLVVALLFGLAIDLVLKALHKKSQSKIEEFCEREDCHCHSSILKPALIHTLKVGAFIFLFTLIMEIIIQLIGEENIAAFVSTNPAIASLLSSVVGLIPNCASSVIISELYVSGYLSAGAMLSGLLANSGVALAVLFRTNRPRKENLVIVLILLAISLFVGMTVDITPLSQWLAIK